MKELRRKGLVAKAPKATPKKPARLRRSKPRFGTMGDGPGPGGDAPCDGVGPGGP